MVYVLDKDGRPLMPTTRYGNVRRMLRSGQAKAVTTIPFTIRLTYRPKTKVVQPTVIGIDPGRTNIGLAVIRENGTCLYQAKCETRNREIPKLMQERRSHRQTSRQGERKARKRLAKRLGTTVKHLLERKLPGYEKPVIVKDIINTEARFNNRRRPKGWLTPTAIQLLRTHENLVKKVQKILPVTRVVLELNKFAFMAMDNPGIRSWQYQKGPLYGFNDTREALNVLQDGCCLLCGKRPIQHIHHIVKRKKGGSNTIANLAGLCEACHALVHSNTEAAERLSQKKAGLNKKYGALSVLNQILPYFLKYLEREFPDAAYVTTGNDTYQFRQDHGIVKDHDTDAYCIACSTLEHPAIRMADHTYRILQFRRHNRANINHQKERTYKLDGNTVAKNRRKRTDQKTPSLIDWFDEMAKLYGMDAAETMRSNLIVKKSRRSYNNRERILPGSIFFFQGKNYVLSAQIKNGAYIRAVGCGTPNFPAKKCQFLCKNTGLVYAG